MRNQISNHFDTFLDNLNTRYGADLKREMEPQEGISDWERVLKAQRWIELELTKQGINNIDIRLANAYVGYLAFLQRFDNLNKETLEANFKNVEQPKINNFFDHNIRFEEGLKEIKMMLLILHHIESEIDSQTSARGILLLISVVALIIGGCFLGVGLNVSGIGLMIGAVGLIYVTHLAFREWFFTTIKKSIVTVEPTIEKGNAVSKDIKALYYDPYRYVTSSKSRGCFFTLIKDSYCTLAGVGGVDKSKQKMWTNVQQQSFQLFKETMIEVVIRDAEPGAVLPRFVPSFRST